MDEYTFENLRIRRMLSDGNCLFHSLAHQLEIKGIFVGEVSAFRKVIAAHLRSNLRRYALQIQCSAAGAFPVGGMDVDVVIERYLCLFEADGFWGGAETLFAVGEMFSMTIRVFYGGGQMSLLPSEGAGPYLDLAYLGINGQSRFHYDSVLSVATPPGDSLMDERLFRLRACAGEYGPFEASPSEPSSTASRAAALSLQKTRMGTWNVRGCVRLSARNEIDRFLYSLDLDIICLQETHLISGQTLTNHYHWFNSGGSARKTARGVSILVRRSSRITLASWKPLSESLCLIQLKFDGGSVRIINVHVPSENDKRMPAVISLLRSQLCRIPRAAMFLVFGDYNAHFGRLDVLEVEKDYVGSTLRHDHSNENGYLLKSLMLDFHLKAVNTFSSSMTVKTTWTSRGIESQIDHLLFHQGDSRFSLQSAVANFSTTHKSDHKILLCVLIGVFEPRVSRLKPRSDLRDSAVIPSVPVCDATTILALIVALAFQCLQPVLLSFRLLTLLLSFLHEKY